MRVLALRTLLIVLFINIGAVLLTGGLLLATLNTANLLADSDFVPKPANRVVMILIIASFMLVLAPAFEWWFKVWRNIDRWLQARSARE